MRRRPLHVRICAAAAFVATSFVATSLVATSLGAQEAPPNQIAWQRSLDDALKLVEATGRPLLVIANDPAEPLSNRLANRIYRTSEFVELTRGFVCVLASPYDEKQPEYDSRGRRRPSRLYGQVLQREYTQIEPKLYERYFDGRRVAPRHLGVAPDGEILFDIFLTNDVSEITGALRKAGKPDRPMPTVEAEDLGALMRSPAASHRALVERLAVDGDRTLRTSIMELAMPTEGTRHPDVIRLGLRDQDAAVRLAAVDALASGASLDELEFLPAAVQILDEEQRDVTKLLDRFDAVAEAGREDRPDWASATERQTRRFRGLHQASERIDGEAWLAHLQDSMPPEGERWASTPPSTDRDTMDQRLGELESAIQQAPADQKALRRIEWAEATLDYARILIRDGADPSFSLSDCVATGTDLMPVDEVRARAAAVAAIAGQLNGEGDPAAAAFVALEDLPADRTTDRVTAELLDVLSNQLRAANYRGSDDPIPLATIADAAWVCRLVPHHPLATIDQGLACVDFFAWLGARHDETEATMALLRRFPNDSRLHDRLRQQRLRDRGPVELQQAYEAWIAEQTPRGDEALASAEWFAGVASVQIASTFILDGRPDAAVTSARSALDRLDTSARRVPGYADSANHWAVFALSAASRAHLDLGELDAAAETAIASLQRRPASVTISDWLGTTPKTIAESVAAALDSADRPDDAAALRSVIKELTGE